MSSFFLFLMAFTYIAVWGYTEFTLWLLYYHHLLFACLFSFCNKPLLSPSLPLCGSVLYNRWQCLRPSSLVLVLPTIPSSWGYSWNSLWTPSRRSCHVLKRLGTRLWNKPSSPKHSALLDFPNIHVIFHFFIKPFLNHSHKV